MLIGRAIRVLVAVGACASVAGAAESRDYTLARDGEARVAVVIPEEAHPVLRNAAGDLAAYLGRIISGSIDVVVDGAPTPECAIHVGPTRRVRAEGLAIEGLSEDGYVIAPAPDAILICGPTPYGTEAGVYGFLRDDLGVRWFMPGELWEEVPSAATLEIRVAERRRQPDYGIRIWSGLISEEAVRWGVRNGVTNRAGRIVPFLGFHHNLAVIFPLSQYGETHPEYYAEIDGVRIIPELSRHTETQPCFTHPDVIRISAEAAAAYFDANPDALQFALGTNDNSLCCQCANCLAMDTPVRMHRDMRQHSESYFSYVEQVAQRVAKTHPGKFIGCLAYWTSELPPRNIERLPDNVLVMLTQDTSQHHDPEYRDLDRAIYREWTGKVKHLGKYDYYGLGWFTPRYFPHLAAEDLKFVHAQGVVGQYCEIYPLWSNTAPHLYMAAQMTWDTSLDADALLDEYFSGVFGEAAPIMKSFYAALERIWTRERPGQWFQGLDWIDGEIRNFDRDRMEEAWQIVQQAHAGSSGRFRERVAYVRDGFEFSYRIVIGDAAARELLAMPISSRDDIEAVIRASSRVLDMAALARKVYERSILPDPLHNFSYYADGVRFWRKFDGWEERLSSAVADRVVKSFDWSRRHLSETERAIITRRMLDLVDSADLHRNVEWDETFAPPMGIAKAPGAMAVDGALDDWQGVPWLTLEPGVEPPVTEVSAEAALCWDDHHLYLACRVKDAVHHQKSAGPMIWEGDSVQFAIDPLRDGLKTLTWSDDDREYGFALGEEGVIVWCWHGLPEEAVRTRAAVVREEGVTIYEAAVPWAELGGAPIRDPFAVSVLVNNSDGRGRFTLRWGRGIEEGKYPRRYKPVLLEE